MIILLIMYCCPVQCISLITIYCVVFLYPTEVKKGQRAGALCEYTIPFFDLTERVIVVRGSFQVHRVMSMGGGGQYRDGSCPYKSGVSIGTCTNI